MKGKGIEREEMWGWRWDKERETKAPWHYKNTERLALKCKSEISSEVPDKFWVFIIFSPFPPPPLSNFPASLNPFLSSSVFQSSISGFVFSILILNKNWAKNKTEKQTHKGGFLKVRCFRTVIQFFPFCGTNFYFSLLFSPLSLSKYQNNKEGEFFLSLRLILVKIFFHSLWSLFA